MTKPSNLSLDGSTAPPRKNGELVFAEPWEGRAFGVAVALCEQGRYEWREFSNRLAAEIAAAELTGSGASYYECWLAALESLAADKGFVTLGDLAVKAREIASAPPGHDHHDHDHRDHAHA